MDIDRWTETFDLVKCAHEEAGCDEANVVAALRCLESTNKSHLSADLEAVATLYPLLLRRKTAPFLYFILKISAVALYFDDRLIRSIDLTCSTLNDERITRAWMGSIWRRGAAE